MVHEKTSETHQNRKIRKIRKTQVPVPNGRDGICDRSQGGHLKKKKRKRDGSELTFQPINNESFPRVQPVNPPNLLSAPRFAGGP